jgi:hypothetical protein
LNEFVCIELGDFPCGRSHDFDAVSIPAQPHPTHCNLPHLRQAVTRPQRQRELQFPTATFILSWTILEYPIEIDFLQRQKRFFLPCQPRSLPSINGTGVLDVQPLYRPPFPPSLPSLARTNESQALAGNETRQSFFILPSSHFPCDGGPEEGTINRAYISNRQATASQPYFMAVTGGTQRLYQIQYP